MLWGLPRVGGTKSPDIARILDLKPDLVFANAEENRREDVEALRESGIEVDVSLPKKVGEVPGCRAAVGKAARVDRPGGGRWRRASRLEWKSLEADPPGPPVSLRLLDLEGPLDDHLR